MVEFRPIPTFRVLCLSLSVQRLPGVTLGRVRPAGIDLDDFEKIPLVKECRVSIPGQAPRLGSCTCDAQAAVVCHQLGLRGGAVLGVQPGSGPIWLSAVACDSSAPWTHGDVALLPCCLQYVAMIQTGWQVDTGIFSCL